MYKDIAQFLNASPKWIENWLTPLPPVKAKYHSYNPLMNPEVITAVLWYLPLDKHKGINEMWNKEIDRISGKKILGYGA